MKAHLFSIGLKPEEIRAAESAGHLEGATLEEVYKHFPPHVRSAEMFRRAVELHQQLRRK